MSASGPSGPLVSLSVDAIDSFFIFLVVFGHVDSFFVATRTRVTFCLAY